MNAKTAPNFVTFIGIILSGVYAWAYSVGWHPYVILTLYVTAGSTDLVDGFLARQLNQKSRLGALLDPIRDRLLSLAVLGNLFVIHGQTLAWFLSAIVITELGIVFVNYRQGFPGVRPIGRFRTGAHAAGATLLLASYYAFPFLGDAMERILFLFLAGASFVTFVDYARQPTARRFPATA